MNVRRAIAGLALTLVAATGCSEQATQDAVDDARDQASAAIDEADLPEVNWEDYSGDLQDRLDNLAANADCAGLKEELAKMEGNDTEVTEYIKAQIEALDC